MDEIDLGSLWITCRGFGAHKSCEHTSGDEKPKPRGPLYLEADQPVRCPGVDTILSYHPGLFFHIYLGYIYKGLPGMLYKTRSRNEARLCCHQDICSRRRFGAGVGQDYYGWRFDNGTIVDEHPRVCILQLPGVVVPCGYLLIRLGGVLRSHSTCHCR